MERQSLDQIFGGSTQGGSAGGGQKSLQEIFGSSAKPMVNPQTPPTTSPDANNNGTVGDFATNINKDLSSRGQDLAHAITDAPQRTADLTKATGNAMVGSGLANAETGLRAAGAVGGGLLDFANDAVKMIPGVAPLLQHISSNLSAQQQDPSNSNSWGNKLVKTLNDFATAHPEIAKDLGAGANIAGAVGGMKGLQEAGANAPKVIQGVKDTVGGAVDAVKGLVMKSPEATAEDALSVVKPRLTPTEEAAAKAAGRGKTSGILKTTTITPTKTELEMAQYAKEAGIKSSNTFDQNIQLAKDAQKASAEKLRAGLQNSDAIWNQNDVKSVLSKVEKPLTIKSDTTLNKLADNFQKAVIKVAQSSDKKAVGILDMRQAVDDLINKEFPANIYSKDTPIGQYVRNVRQSLNDFASSKLPDGKLPDGSTLKGELRRQSLLYNAIDNMSETAPKSGSNIVTRAAQTIKDHPVISTLGAAAVGGEALKHILP